MSKTKDKDNRKDKFEKLQAQANEYLNGWQRAKADYVNLKKETDDKILRNSTFVKSKVFTEFLPIYANLLSAFDHIPESEQNASWAVGFFHIKKQLEDFLAEQKIFKIETVGQEFDHNMHDAVEIKHDKEREDNIILTELASGFKLEDEIIIHPKVIVNRWQEENK